jgi:hypothetical protein
MICSLVCSMALACKLSGLSCFGHLTPPSNSESMFVQLNIGMVIHGFATIFTRDQIPL